MKTKMLFFGLLLSCIFGFGQGSTECTSSGIGAKKISRCYGKPKTFASVPGVIVRVKGPIENAGNSINDEKKKTYTWVFELSGSTKSLFNIRAVSKDGKKLYGGYGGVDENGNDDDTVPYEITQKMIDDLNLRLKNKIVFQGQTFSSATIVDVSLIPKTSTFKGNSSTVKHYSSSNGSDSENRTEEKIDEKWNTRAVIFFQNGKKIKVEGYYLDTGELRFKNFLDENEKIKEAFSYDKNGNLTYHHYYKDGKILPTQ